MCGTPFAGKREDSKFCSNSCKAKHWEQKKQGKAPNLGGITPAVNPDERAPALTTLPPLANTLHDTPDETGKAETQMPPRYITKLIKEENPAYKEIAAKLNECRAQIKKCNEEIQRLKTMIEDEKRRDGTRIIIAGTGSGALIGYNMAKPTASLPQFGKKIKSKKTKPAQKPKEDNQLLYTFLGGLLGFGVSKLINAGTEKTREQNKAKVISECQKRIELYEAQLQALKTQEGKLSFKLFGLPEFTSKEVKVENPAFQSLWIAKQVRQLTQPQPLNTPNKPLAGTEYAGGKIIPMGKIAGIKHALLNFQGKWKDFFGLPQAGFFCVIHGMSGEGKSTFAMQFGKYLAQQFGMVLFVSGEEGFAATFQHKIEQFKTGNIPTMYGGDIRSGEELLREVPVNKFHFIVIDSLNNMGIDPEMMKQIRSKFKQSAIIAICQSTKDGKVRGSYEMIHDSDIAVKVTNGIALTTKNRFKEKGMQFDVFKTMRKHDSPEKPGNAEDSGRETDLKNTV